MNATRALLARHGLSAKKSWGQNFLCDPRVVDRIVNAVGVSREDWVVEIGAGLGVLTAPLCDRAGRVIAIERDPDMIQILQTELGDRLLAADDAAVPAPEPGASNLILAAENALTFDHAAWARTAGRPLVVAGNLPYQITSPLLFGLLDAAGGGQVIGRAIVMVQKEFADRAVAAPGSKTYGRLSVMLQQHADVEMLFRVSPAAFVPQPRVISAIMRLIPRAQSRAPVPSAALFADVVRFAFATRRKMLRNALEAGFDRDLVAAALAAAAVDGNRRAETLSIAEFGRLTQALADGGTPRA